MLNVHPIAPAVQDYLAEADDADPIDPADRAWVAEDNARRDAWERMTDSEADDLYRDGLAFPDDYAEWGALSDADVLAGRIG